MNDAATAAYFRRVFFPYAAERAEKALAMGARFAYYTSAEVAVSILSNREVWLRNASVMNDFREISHGLECLSAALDGQSGQILKAALNAAHSELYDEIMSMLGTWGPTIANDTYLICLSEHPAYEDFRGRLSMWRAYGGTTGVALVLHGAVMFSESDVLGATSSPVFYGDARAFEAQFEALVLGIATEHELLKGLERSELRNVLFTVLRFAALCTKHPGFEEEREWRVIASPLIRPSNRLLPELRVVRGVPQKILKIKLENSPEQGLVGLALPELLSRIIIGPCDHPRIMFRAFYDLLTDLGIERPEERITISDTPLRHRS